MKTTYTPNQLLGKIKIGLLLIIMTFALNAIGQRRIQSTTGNTGTNASTTMTVVMPQSPSNGNTLIAVIATRSSTVGSVSTITQAGATWVRADYSRGTSGSTTEIWYTTSLSSAATSIAILQGNDRAAAVIMEYSGILYASPLDKTAYNNGRSATVSTGTTATTSLANELLIGGIGLSSSAYVLSSITNSFTEVDNSSSTNATQGNNAKVYVLEKFATSTEAASTGGNAGTKAQFSGVIASFKQLVSSFTPTATCNGSETIVTVNGQNFTSGSVVSIDGINAASTTYNSSTQLTASLATNTTTGFVNVTTVGNGSGSSSDPLLIKSPNIPTADITKVSCSGSADGQIQPNNIPNAINFDYTKSQYINLGETLLNDLSAFTVEGWIKTNNYSRNSFFGQDNAVEMGFASNGTIELWSEGLGTNLYSPSAFPTDNAWHHVAGVGNGNNMSIYIDGVQVATRIHTPTSNYGSSTTNAMIGGYVWNNGSGNYFNGQMLKVGFWDKALSPLEIAKLASIPHHYVTGETGLIAGYNFYSGSGTSLVKVPAGTNGTFTGSPVPTWSDLFTYSWSKAGGGYSASTKNISSIPTGTYTLEATFNGCSSMSEGFVVGSTNELSVAADSISGTSSICLGSSSSLSVNGGTLGTAAEWRWYSGSCGGTLVGSGTSIVVSPTVSTTYYVRAEGTCNTTDCVSFTVNVNTSGTWLGSTDTVWNTDSNWCGGVPTLGTDVIIPSAPINQPHVGTVGAVCKSLTIQSGATVTMGGAFAFNIYGNWTNNGTFVPATSTVNIAADASILGSSTTTFNNLAILETKTLTASAGTMNVTANWTNNGTFVDNGGTVVFNGTSAGQTIGGTASSTFNNLTIDNSFSGGGVKAGNNITVNGILNLAAANASDTLGALDMDPVYSTDVLSSCNNLYMGPNATTIGIGDVTGRIIRTTITKEKALSFGNALNTIEIFNNIQDSMPSQIEFISRIGVRHSVKINTVKRYYQIVKMGGGVNSKFNLKLHYLDSELDTITENRLVFWDHHITYDGVSPHEHGKTELDMTNNWLTLSGHTIKYLAWEEYDGEVSYDAEHQENIGKAKIWMMSGKQLAAENMWIGAVNTQWNEPSNWSAGLPTSTTNVLIIDPTNGRHPVIPDGETKEVKSITINTGASLTAGAGSTLTVNGDLAANNGTASWNNQGTFYPTTSTVNFTGSTAAITGSSQFYNLSIGASTELSMISGSEISVSGTIANSGVLNTNFNGSTTFIYNGTSDQNVSASNYYNLELSGAGTKTLPASSVSILGDLTLNSDISSTGNTIVMNGSSAQTISSTTEVTFNNLTINNAAGVTLGSNETVNGALILTSGMVNAEDYVLTMTCNASVSGQDATRYVNGKLAREYCAAESKIYPIGRGGVYRPLTLEYTSLDANSTVQAEQFESEIQGTIPDNTTYQSERYWNLTETSGAGDGNYLLTLDGDSFSLANGASAKILRGDASKNTLLSAGYATPSFTSESVTDNTFGNFAVAYECLPPSIDIQPTKLSSCESDGVSQFSVTATGGSLTYQWEVSSTGKEEDYSSVANAAGVYSGATTTSLSITNPPFSMNGYVYRVVVTNECGSVSTSKTAVLTVNPKPQGSLSGNTICKGEEGFLTWTSSSGTAPFTVVYNDGVDVISVSNINSGATISVGTLIATKTYTLVSVSDYVNCTRSTYFTVGSADVTVNAYISWTGDTDTDWNTASNWCGGVPTISDNVIIPASATNQPVISNLPTATTKALIIESGASVTVDGDYTLNVDGDLTNNGTLNLDLGSLVVNEASQVENNGLIETKNTTASPLPTNVNYGGTVKFNGAQNQYLFAGNFKDIIIENNAGVIVQPSTVITATGNLSVGLGSKLQIGAASSITVNKVLNSNGTAGILLKASASLPNSSLIYNNTIEEPVNATVQMYSPASWTGTTTKTYYWQFMGIPVKRLGSIDQNFYGAYVRKFNEKGYGTASSIPLLKRHWVQLGNTDVMTSLAGYEIVQAAPKIYTFAGQLVTNNIDTTLAYTPTYYNVNEGRYEGQYPGQHLLGNPYTSAIRISDIVFGNHMDSTVYIYNTGSYSQWLALKGTYASNAGQYISAPLNTAGVGDVPGEIPSMQAFLVRTNVADTGSIYINYNNVKQRNTKTQRAPKQKMTWMKFNMTSKNSGGDVMWLFSNPQTTIAFDNGWDGQKFVGSSGTPLIYANEVNDALQIDAKPDINETMIALRAGSVDSEYTMTVTSDNLSTYYDQIYLFDILTNDIVNITESGASFNFTASNQSPSNRFQVLTSMPQSTGLDKGVADKLNVFSSGQMLFVENKTNESGHVYVIDLLGKVARKYPFAIDEFSAKNMNLPVGTYILKTVTDTKNQSRNILIQ